MLLIQDDQSVQDNTPVKSALRVFCAHFDPLQIIPMMVLLTAGILFIYGIGQQAGGFYATLWQRHIFYLIAGLALWFFFTFLDYRRLYLFELVLYPVSLLLLVYVLFFGVRYYGASRWIDLFGISVQPSEIAKFTCILVFAKILSMKQFPVNSWKTLLFLAVLAGIPAFLIFRQPNLSMTLTLCFCCFAIVFAAGLKWKYMLIGILVVSVMLPVGYSMLRPYHKERIKVFLNPQHDPLNKGWNQLQSELAVGSGGLTGKGFMQGTQNQFGYLPQTVANSDFIFSIIAEETGFVGSIFLLLMYATLLISIFRTALNAPDEFGQYLCIGTGTVFAVHTIVNIGMSIRLMPVTGLPLPLVSYGGTFLLASFSYLGIVQSVYAARGRNDEDE